MKNVEILVSALEYIEAHLDEELQTKEVADACFCSKSTLEKMFRHVNQISLHDYLIRRRMMKAARMLSENPQIGILEVALMFGYSSNEAFTRAFKQVWNCKPSEFRKARRYSELYPRLKKPLEDGDDYMRTRKSMDISELYDLFRDRRKCYFVCCDIRNLIPINEISRKAGDLAILEAMERMNRVAGEEDVVFRIGGDEFAILTDHEDIAYAEQIEKQLTEQNEQCFSYEDRQIPLSLHVGIVKIDTPEEKVPYDELFVKLHSCIRDSR